MKITLRNIWFSSPCPETSKGILEIEGVGEQQIIMPLPQAIIDQAEAFYIAEYRRRMEKVSEAA